MARTRIALDPELVKRARQRAAKIGLSLDEYVSSLVESDLRVATQSSNISSIFNLGSSGGSNIAANKDAMIAEAFCSFHTRRRVKPPQTRHPVHK